MRHDLRRRAGDARSRARRRRRGRRRVDLDDERVVADGNGDRADVGVAGDRRCSCQRVVDLHGMMHAAQIDGDALGRIGYLGVGRIVPELGLRPDDKLVGAVALAEHHAVARGRHIAQGVVQWISRLVAALAVIGEDARQIVDSGRGELRCSVGVEQSEFGLRIGRARRRIPIEHLIEIGRAHAILVGIDQRVQDGFGLHRLVNAEILSVGLRGVARFRNDDGLSRCRGRDGAQCRRQASCLVSRRC